MMREYKHMGIPASERLERMRQWWNRENDRPLLGFMLGTYYPLKRYPQGSRKLSGPVRPEDIDVSEFLDDTDRLFDLHEEAGGDMLFSAAPFFGVPWLEAALGCGVVADPVTGSMRSLPPPGFSSHPDVPVFSEFHPWVQKLLEFIPALESRSGGRYPVGVTLMRGVSDLLSALYGGDRFVYRMVDAPGEVHRVIEGLTSFWIAFGRCLIDRLPLFQGGTGSFLYGLWSPGKFIWMQEDAAALLSPRMYEEFILPADRALAAAFPRTIVHLHPTRFIPVKQLLGASVSAVELHIDRDGPRAESLWPHYDRILASRPLYIWGDLTREDLDFVFSRLPRRGLAAGVLVDTPEEARRLWDAYWPLLASGENPNPQMAIP
jgi:hypothetical protein